MASPDNSDTHDIKCWTRPCEHTSAGLCISATCAGGAAVADARDTTTTARARALAALQLEHDSGCGLLDVLQLRSSTGAAALRLQSTTGAADV